MSPNRFSFLSGSCSHQGILVRSMVLVLVFTVDLATIACNQALNFPSQSNQSSADRPNPDARDRVHVEITPAAATLAPSRKLQFTASVTNTRNPAVTWTASAGSISRNGLFAAPHISGTEKVIVTATSRAHPWARARVTVMVMGSAAPPRNALNITTRGIPAGTSGAPYAAYVVASGGQSPYEWSIGSGSLPRGLRLDPATGMISGITPKIGTFSFTIRVTSAAAQLAQQRLTLRISPAGDSCGPPTYNCSRTDVDTVQIPNPVPTVGNLVGANRAVTDPDFQSRIVRLTDAQTNPQFANISFITTASGSADENIWNTDFTLFLVQDTGDGSYPMEFDPATMQATTMYASNYVASKGLRLSHGGSWSRVNPHILYTFGGTAIQQLDFSDRATPPTAQPFYDFTSSGNCLPAGFKTSWQSIGGVSAGDTMFSASYSNAGNQGTGVYALVYKPGSGCRMLNTQTGQVTGDWGQTGFINIPDRFSIHNVKLSNDGSWLIVARTHCYVGSCEGPVFWKVDTTMVSNCETRCSGHWTDGYSHWVNNNQTPMGQYEFRPFSDVTARSSLIGDLPAHITAPFDQHQSWNNVDAGDSVPFLSATWSDKSPFPTAWYNEIIGVATEGSGKVWRFAHSFITARSQRFSTRYAIGSVSQDGRFFLFSSDWVGTLGSESGSNGCTIGKDCRGDVFVVELK